MTRTKRLVLLSAITAVAMILSFVESRIPPLIAIPGVKVGLANIAVIFALYRLGVGRAACVSLVRVLLVSLLFGTPASFLYSLTGALLSLGVMVLCKHFSLFGTVGVSVLGGVCHNLGQILMACIVTKTNLFSVYFPVLLLSGTLAGIVIGLAGAMLVKRLSNIKKAV